MKLFNKVAHPRVSSNTFDLSHEFKHSCKQAQLIPFLCEDVNPGDHFKQRAEIFVRYAPMISPVMHRSNVYTHYFFVPNRIIWDQWEEFVTGGRDGTSAPAHPYMVYDNVYKQKFEKGRLPDYIGLPIPGTGTQTARENINALPFRAYLEIYNEWYRDANLTDPVPYGKGSGNVTDQEMEDLTLVRYKAWEKDYLTSCLPNAQRGPDVIMPSEVSYSATSTVRKADGTDFDGNQSIGTGGTTGSPNNNLAAVGGANNQEQGRIENIENVDITINDLRRSARLQEWLERSMRGGPRYIENVLAHWGVKSSDSRLQRPELLGGGRSNVSISEVLQTSSTQENQSPQANMAGHGISVGTNHKFRRRFEEHGWVIGVMCVIPRTSYMQSIDRRFSRLTRFDYPWPEFANIGEQEVKNKEAWFGHEDTDENNNKTFGYQSRYAENKFRLSHVAGDFRDKLDFWHQGRKFTERPNLNEKFVTADPTSRIFAITDPTEDKLYCHVYNDLKVKRKLPRFGTPKL